MKTTVTTVTRVDSPFANPFKIGMTDDESNLILMQVGIVAFGPRIDRRAACNMFELWFKSQRDLVEKARAELRGKVLGCWCHPQACHGDVLAAICDERPKGTP